MVSRSGLAAVLAFAAAGAACGSSTGVPTVVYGDAGPAFCGTCVPDNACHAGAQPCNAALACQDTGIQLADGTSCDNVAVCKQGACVTCSAGAACAPADICHAGIVSCGTGSPVCVDTGLALADGASCASGSVCRSGACSACQGGAACQPASACHTGVLSCVAGAPLCFDTGNAKPDGTDCGDDLVCHGGDCAPCVAGESCTPQNACHTGVTSCATGVSVCVDSGSNQPGGTACTIGPSTPGVCSAGVCGACQTGAACTPANACHQGHIECGSGLPLCVDDLTNAPDGTVCPGGSYSVCGAGVCAPCARNTTCAFTNPCHRGQIACDSGGPVCADSGANIADGASCGSDQVCRNGACVACQAGVVCTPPNLCHQGRTSCGTGVPVCADTSAPAADGTNCGIGLVCRSGACVICRQGAACSLAADSCRHGRLDCSSGTGVCQDGGSDFADGAACAVDKVCSGGVCTPCATGGACTPANSCHAGATACGTGQPVCTDTQTNRPNGTACDTDKVCYLGGCVACAAGTSCTPTNRCHTGSITCVTGQPACADSGNSLGDGSSCGVNQACRSGGCVFCQAGVACSTSIGVCKTGATSCATGLSVCAETGNKTAGTSCGTNLVCKAGGCVSCTAGASCVPANPCRTGTISCGTGDPLCGDAGANLAQGAACGNGQQCNAGSCTTFTLVVESGDGQTGWVDQALGPVTVRVLDGANAPVAGLLVTFSAPPGAATNPASQLTTSLGRVTLNPRLGRAPGVQTFGAVAAGGASTTFTATASMPPDRRIFTLANVDRVRDTRRITSAPATMSHVGYTYGVAAAADGTVYFTDDCMVRKISPAGVLSDVAGTGTCGYSGDGADALAARLYNPYGLALDESAGLLYIADNSNDRVRVVTLLDGMIQSVAGGGPTSAPSPWGDGGDASAATLSSPRHLALAADGTLYIADFTHERIRKVNPLTGVISTVLAPSTFTTCTTPAVRWVGCGAYTTGCSVVVTPDGNLFVSGSLCWVTTNGTSTNGIVRVAPNGTLSHVAGFPSGPVTGNVPATSAGFPAPPQLAMDAVGNLFMAPYFSHGVRRLEGTTGRVTLAVGAGIAGYSGDYGEALDARLDTIYGLAFDSHRHLYIAEQQNFLVRTAVGLGATSTLSPTLTAVAGDAQSVEVSRIPALPLSVRLRDGAGVNLSGYNVEWASLDRTAHIYVPRSSTILSGVASASVRLGLTPRNYQFQASFQDPHGRHAIGSPVTFTLRSYEPPAGTMVTLVNVDRIHSNLDPAIPGIATLAHVGYVAGVAAASDGSIYFSDDCTVRRLMPDGMVVNVAGTGTCGFNADPGPARDTRLYNPQGLALDETAGFLYIADRSNDRVRALRLSDMSMATIAGGGTSTIEPFGDGGPATAATLLSPAETNVGPDGAVYVSDFNHDRIRRVDMETGVITTWLAAGTGTCSGPAFRGCGVYVGGCDIAWNAASTAYISGYVCPATGTTVTWGVVARAPGGTMSYVAGLSGGGLGEGVLATAAAFTGGPNLALDASGRLYLSQYMTHKVRRIEGGRIYTVTGTGTTGFAGDWGPATAALIHYPRAIDFTPSGHLIIADTSNYGLRAVW